MEHDKIVKMLFRVVDEINEMLPPEGHLEKDLNAPLAGERGQLDSAGLVNLIVATEEKAAAELNLPLLLTDDETMSRIEQVFETLGSLANHISAMSHETIER